MTGALVTESSLNRRVDGAKQFDESTARHNIPRVMQKDTLAPVFHRLGINPPALAALRLLPLVYVAWAEGKPGGLRRQRLVDLGRVRFQLGRDAERVLLAWLSRRPSENYFEAGLRCLERLARARDDGNIDVAELPGILIHAEGIARTKHTNCGSPSIVTPAEERALAHLGWVLRTDIGETWTALLRELGETEPAVDRRAA
jgi:hypothetical protein